MLTRIVTSVVALAVLLPALYFSHTAVFPALLAIVGVICLYEMLKCVGFHQRIGMVFPLYGFAVAAPFLLRYTQGATFARIAFLAATLYLLYLFAWVIWSHGQIAFSDGAAVYLLALYILASLSSILYVRDFEDGGKYIYLLIFIGAWVTDTFAYFTGYFFGKHKLIEDVSPKKTVEGSIGGILFCAVGFVTLGLVVDHWFGQHANVLFLLVAGVILSVVSQIGDLIMSVIKRHYHIKDFGKIFPGHGGMLDRFDSILAVSLGLGAVCMFASLSGLSLM